MSRLPMTLLFFTLTGCGVSPSHPAVELATVGWADLGVEPIVVDLGWGYVWPDLTRVPPPVDASVPAVACVPDAAVTDAGAACVLPHSTCLNDDWLLYYLGGMCVDGTCKWEPRYLDCRTMDQYSCRNGGCASNATL